MFGGLNIVGGVITSFCFYEVCLLYKPCFWISEQTKNELYELIIAELEERHKFKNIEVVLGNNIVLVLSINRKKIRFNLWDGYTWIKSYWLREFKVGNLFGY